MANLHKHTVQEALNSESSGVWDVQLSTAPLTTSLHLEVTNYHNIIIDTTATFDVLFDTAIATSNNDTHDLKITEGVTVLRVPHGLKNSSSDEIWLHYRADGSLTPTVRIVLC